MASLFKAIKNLKNSSAFAKLGDLHTNAMGYRKMGLRFDDLASFETPIMTEALRRLPDDVAYQRLFRIRRALLTSIKQETSIEQDKWTTAENDVRYLTPYVEVTEAEFESHQNFDDLTLSAIPAALKNRNRSS
ncbi:cytochrome b-c1 complex subunit 7, partial [Gorgonomyces haynaldii]